MSEKEQVQAIIDKYHQSMSELSDKATAKEFKFVMTYIAQEANKRQRQTIGLDESLSESKTSDDGVTI